MRKYASHKYNQNKNRNSTLQAFDVLLRMIYVNDKNLIKKWSGKAHDLLVFDRKKGNIK